MEFKNYLVHSVFRATLALTIAVVWVPITVDTASAESLFRASANYSASTPYTPNSLYSQPLPNSVGDMLTILIDEQTIMSNSAQLEIERTQAIQENSSGLLNRVIHKIGVPQRFSFPDFNGLDTDNNLESQASASRTSQLKDTISVQVVQILPNGNLVVQGTKVVLINRDRVNMMVTGIINPYYLNQNNQIASTQVGNFQMLMSGKGIINRQQNDGIFNKVFQFFN